MIALGLVHDRCSVPGLPPSVECKASASQCKGSAGEGAQECNKCSQPYIRAALALCTVPALHRLPGIEAIL